MDDKQIYQTENFVIERVLKTPHVSREDGGHIIIRPKKDVADRTKLTAQLAIELMRLTIIAGEAMATALNRRGIDVGRINYQDNGNWSVFKPGGPLLHIHLYGRAKSAKIHKWGDACYFPHKETGFYDFFEPLNDGDIEEIKNEIAVLCKEDKYQDKNWYL